MADAAEKLAVWEVGCEGRPSGAALPSVSVLRGVAYNAEQAVMAAQVAASATRGGWHTVVYAKKLYEIDWMAVTDQTTVGVGSRAVPSCATSPCSYCEQLQALARQGKG